MENGGSDRGGKPKLTSGEVAHGGARSGARRCCRRVSAPSKRPNSSLGRVHGGVCVAAPRPQQSNDPSLPHAFLDLIIRIRSSDLGRSATRPTSTSQDWPNEEALG